MAGFGEYALVFASVGAFNRVFNDAGLGTILLREISQRPEQRAALLTSAAALQACLAVTTYALMLVTLRLLDYPEPVKQAAAVFGLSILLTPLDLLALPFQADLRLSKLVPPSLFGLSINFGLTLAVIALHGPLLLLIAAALAALVVQAAWTAHLSLQVIRFEATGATQRWREFLAEAWPLWLGTIGSALFLQAPLLVLSMFSLESVGLYNAANKVPQQLLILPLAVRNSTLPTLARAWIEDRARFGWILDRMVRGMLLLLVPIVMGIVGLSAPIVELFFGPQFAAAVPPLVVLAGVLAVLCPSTLVGEAFIATGRQRLNLAIQTATAPVLLLSLWVLVPIAGATGAAVAVLVGYVAVLIGTFGAAAVALDQRRLLFTLPPAAAACIVASAVLALTTSLGPWLSAPAAALTAALILGLTQRATVRELCSYVPLRYLRRNPGRWPTQDIHRPGLAADGDAPNVSSVAEHLPTLCLAPQPQDGRQHGGPGSQDRQTELGHVEDWLDLHPVRADDDDRHGPSTGSATAARATATRHRGGVGVGGRTSSCGWAEPVPGTEAATAKTSLAVMTV